MKHTRILIAAFAAARLCMNAEPGAAGGGTPPAPPPPEPPAPPAPKVKMIKARVLMDCAHGKVNDVVEVTEAEAKGNTALDTHKDAVAYAEGLKKAEAKKAEG